MFAFVALDERSIAYMARDECKTCMNFRSESHRGDYQSERFMVAVERSRAMRKEGMTPTQIGAALGVTRTQASRYLQATTRERKGKYFRDFPFANAIK